MNDADDLGSWCSGVPGLRAAGPGRWAAAAIAEVSYPSQGHRVLAEIEHASYWFGHRNDVIAAVVSNHPPAGRIFDIGGGNGFVSLGLTNAGFGTVVIEPGGHGADLAAARGLPVIQAAFQDMDIAPGSIPAAGLFDVLEHIEDDRAALANLYRALAPGGMLYIAVPSHQMLWSEEDAAAGHFRRYSLQGLANRISGAGFTVEFGTYFFGALVLPIFLLRALPHRLRLYGARSEERTQSDHALPDNALGRMLAASFARELARIRRDRPVRIGASCIVAARKPA